MIIPSIERLRDLREQYRISHEKLKEAKIKLNAKNTLTMWKAGQLVTVNGIVCRVKKYSGDMCPCTKCMFILAHGASFPCADCINVHSIVEGKNKLQFGHYLQPLCTKQDN